MPDNYVALLGTKGGPAIRPGSTMPTSALYVLNGQKIVVARKECLLSVGEVCEDHHVLAVRIS